MNVHEIIRSFVIETFIFDDNPQTLDNTQSFLETGVIDSTGMLELVSFIEEKFNIKIEDDELIPDNLDSVNNVVNYIARKTGARVQGTG